MTRRASRFCYVTSCEGFDTLDLKEAKALLDQLSCVLRQADRGGAEFRGTGGHRNGECPAADRMRQRTDEVAELNRGLEARVAEQVEELGRVGRLKRFLAPQLAELIARRAMRRSLKAIGVRSSSCSVTCAATPPLPKPPNPRKSSIFSANTMVLWGHWSASSRGRSTNSRPTVSWCSSTIPSDSRPGRARGQDGDGDARGRRGANRRLAPPRS